jgi:exonuclease III
MSAMIGMGMLADFLRKQEIDIILLQEVTQNDFDLIRGYKAYTNVGINKHGTAIFTREAIQLTNIMRVPLGYGMAGFYRGVWIVNIYMRRLDHPMDRRERLSTIWTSPICYVHCPPTMITGGF